MRRNLSIDWDFESVFGCLVILVFAIAIVSFVGSVCKSVIFFGAERLAVEEVTGHVNPVPNLGVYQKSYSEGGNMIYHVGFIKDTPNGQEEEVFQNHDAWLWGKFTSADFQQKLVPGKRYKLTVVGIRFGLTSDFRNIVKIEPLPENLNTNFNGPAVTGPNLTSTPSNHQ